ncbi:quinohemoprotein amine dehydrogenase subunit gamma [Sporosarcina soli]|uniref:Quinohemoprotein amine dehydrogenase subunit gamma n=1 Tax=Sporosarcina soli TaxID=334736 RepID=A0ABW0TEH8_9BACL
MKHSKPLNRKGKMAMKRINEGEKMDVEGLQLPIGCTTVFDPGWEADSSEVSVFGLCQPMERDLYGCYGDCWWAAQVPDGLSKYPEWHQDCPAAVRDWQKLKFIDG